MKVITPDNYLVRPFRVNKTWQFNYTYRNLSDSSSVRIDVAEAPPSNWNSFTDSSPQNADNIYTQTLYSSVQTTFYTGSTSEGTRFIPIGSLTKQFYPTGSQFYVVNIEQQSFGESVRPGSFSLTAASSTASIYDNGNGQLVSSVTPTTVIGNIFYPLGIAVIAQDTGSYSGSLITNRGMYLVSGSTVSVRYQGIHTIYEHQVICTVEPNEFNFSTNPTLHRNTLNGILNSGSNGTGTVGVELIFSGTMPPYFTTVGLYNDIGEMLAVAKFPTAKRRAINSQQTVIVRFDA